MTQMWRVKLAKRDGLFNDRFAIRVWADTEHHARGIAYGRHRDCVVLGKPQPQGKFRNGSRRTTYFLDNKPKSKARHHPSSSQLSTSVPKETARPRRSKHLSFTGA